MGAVAQRKLFKSVSQLVCIFCDKEFPTNQKDFKTINKHGWGSCGWCWKRKIAESRVYIPAKRLKMMQGVENA